MLRKLIEEDGLVGNWDQDLPGALMAYNSSRHSTTGVSPYHAVFGHESLLPLDAAHATVTDSQNMTSDEFAAYLAVKNEARKRIHNNMMKKIKENQERMRIYHRKRNVPPEYSVGDKVLLRNKKRDDRKGNKLETTWCSTVYRVDVVRGRNTYHISNNGIRLKRMVDACHLKKYNE